MIFFSNLRKCTSRANEFLYINVETKNLKKFTSPANEFLLDKCRNKNYFIFKSEKTYKSS